MSFISSLRMFEDDESALELTSLKFTKAVEFDNPKFIQSVNTAYTVSTGQSVDSSCTVKFKYSEDKENFSDWITFTSSYTLNKNITNLEFNIDMAEGWNNATSTAISPYVSQLYYTEVSPAVNYLFTTALTSSEDIFEYIISTNYSDDKSTLTWGICKGDSTNWNDYEELIINKNGILVSRQRSYKYSNSLSYDKLSCIKSINDNYTYFVYNNGDKFRDILVTYKNLIDKVITFAKSIKHKFKNNVSVTYQDILGEIDLLADNGEIYEIKCVNEIGRAHV